MIIDCTVKVINEMKSGYSRSSGNPYKYQAIILEWADNGQFARAMASMGTEQVESFAQQGIKVGDRVRAEVCFATQLRNDYVENRVYVRNIQLKAISQS